MQYADRKALSRSTIFMGAVQEQNATRDASCKRRVASVRKELRACVWEA